MGYLFEKFYEGLHSNADFTEEVLALKEDPDDLRKLT
jgi:hypothetical protein